MGVVERGPLRGREQEWNISEAELEEMVEVGVLSEQASQWWGGGVMYVGKYCPRAPLKAFRSPPFNSYDPRFVVVLFVRCRSTIARSVGNISLLVIEKSERIKTFRSSTVPMVGVGKERRTSTVRW